MRKLEMKFEETDIEVTISVHLRDEDLEEDLPQHVLDQVVAANYGDQYRLQPYVLLVDTTQFPKRRLDVIAAVHEAAKRLSIPDHNRQIDAAARRLMTVRSADEMLAVIENLGKPRRYTVRYRGVLDVGANSIDEVVNSLPPGVESYVAEEDGTVVEVMVDGARVRPDMEGA